MGWLPRPPQMPRRTDPFNTVTPIFVLWGTFCLFFLSFLLLLLVLVVTSFVFWSFVYGGGNPFLGAPPFFALRLPAPSVGLAATWWLWVGRRRPAFWSGRDGLTGDVASYGDAGRGRAPSLDREDAALFHFLCLHSHPSSLCLSAFIYSFVVSTALLLFLTMHFVHHCTLTVAEVSVACCSS